MNKSTDDTEQLILKQTILSQNLTFKGAFRATMGFYTAQFVATLMGAAFLASVFVILALLYKAFS